MNNPYEALYELIKEFERKNELNEDESWEETITGIKKIILKAQIELAKRQLL
jgi:hypothetical protein